MVLPNNNANLTRFINDVFNAAATLPEEWDALEIRLLELLRTARPTPQENPATPTNQSITAPLPVTDGTATAPVELLGSQGSTESALLPTTVATSTATAPRPPQETPPEPQDRKRPALPNGPAAWRPNQVPHPKTCSHHLSPNALRDNLAAHTTTMPGLFPRDLTAATQPFRAIATGLWLLGEPANVLNTVLSRPNQPAYSGIHRAKPEQYQYPATGISAHTIKPIPHTEKITCFLDPSSFSGLHTEIHGRQWFTYPILVEFTVATPNHARTAASKHLTRFAVYHAQSASLITVAEPTTAYVLSEAIITGEGDERHKGQLGAKVFPVTAGDGSISRDNQNSKPEVLGLWIVYPNTMFTSP